jgi:hypothetical protein
VNFVLIRAHPVETSARSRQNLRIRGLACYKEHEFMRTGVKE